MESTIEYYNLNKDKFIESTINANMEEFYKTFLDNLEPNSNILDVGCGSGRDSKFFLEKGFNVISFDGSIKICKAASKFIGKEVIHSTFENFTSDIKYQGIWSCASFLHVKKEDMVFILNKYLNLLSSKGVLYASWKYGENELIKDGKYYCNLNEKWFKEKENMLNGKLKKIWITKDVRSNFEDSWINVLLIGN